MLKSRINSKKPSKYMTNNGMFISSIREVYNNDTLSYNVSYMDRHGDTQDPYFGNYDSLGVNLSGIKELDLILNPLYKSSKTADVLKALSFIIEKSKEELEDLCPKKDKMDLIIKRNEIDRYEKIRQELSCHLLTIE